MSDLKVNTISNRAGTSYPSVPQANFITSAIRYAGNQEQIDASLNVSSLTDNGVGLYIVNHTNAFTGSKDKPGAATAYGNDLVERISNFPIGFGESASASSLTSRSAGAFDDITCGGVVTGDLA